MNAVLSLGNRILKKLKNIELLDRRHLHEVWEQAHLERVLHEFKIDCVFDVGANNGQYGRMLRKKAGYRGLIISFEPNPTAAELARTQARHDSSWIVEQIALSSSNGQQMFNVMSGSQFSSLSAPRHDETVLFKDKNVIAEQILVDTETVTTAFRRLRQKYNFSRPFLKLDTQGYDVEIVANAGESLSEFIGLQSELAIKKLYETAVDYRDAIAVYERLGFELSAFVPNNRGHFPLLIETDCIMISRRAIHAMTS